MCARVLQVRTIRESHMEAASRKHALSLRHVIIALALLLALVMPVAHTHATCQCRPTSSSDPLIELKVKHTCHLCGGMFSRDVEYCCRCDHIMFAMCQDYLFKTEEKFDPANYQYDYAYVYD